MKAKDLHRQTFKKGSKTYFNSSLFFPPKVRDKVFILYGFVRVADDYVDATPQQAQEFEDFCQAYNQAMEGKPSGNPIIDDFVELCKQEEIPPRWTEGFLKSMRMDLTKTEYNTIDETLEYIYGSAEVIGLYMSKLLGLEEASYHAAQMQGRSMQYINFIRDIAEDIDLGRRYIPLPEEGLNSFEEEHTKEHPKEWEDFLVKEIDRYNKWQAEAESGYHYIPYRYLVPIKTASDMYNWTARRMVKHPYLLYKGKIKPSKGRIILQILKNSIILLFRRH
ncbi:phytoene/squalene synthase family protein [Spirochaeta cellobiosiphila]|uniref:phytoene/squalene synthase family protein n=1 Tax=Spirochaeta cellobiosiphila TaxID=504483 RepID=UPI000424AA31|nr:phytoene/squalene synthase family protein [Spirochaeta cellobiosiphila]